MAAKSPRSGHVLTPEQLSKGGKKSKRGPSIKKKWEEMLKSKLPETIKKELSERFVMVGDKKIGLNKNALSNNTEEALSYIIMAEALAGNMTAAKLIVEQIDGKATETKKLVGDEENPLHFNLQWPKL